MAGPIRARESFRGMPASLGTCAPGIGGRSQGPCPQIYGGRGSALRVAHDRSRAAGGAVQPRARLGCRVIVSITRNPSPISRNYRSRKTMKTAFAGATLAIALSASPAFAQNVKITPLGSHDGE